MRCAFQSEYEADGCEVDVGVVSENADEHFATGFGERRADNDSLNLQWDALEDLFRGGTVWVVDGEVKCELQSEFVEKLLNVRDEVISVIVVVRCHHSNAFEISTENKVAHDSFNFCIRDSSGNQNIPIERFKIDSIPRHWAEHHEIVLSQKWESMINMISAGRKGQYVHFSCDT